MLLAEASVFNIHIAIDSASATVIGTAIGGALLAIWRFMSKRDTDRAVSDKAVSDQLIVLNREQVAACVSGTNAIERLTEAIKEKK